MKEAYIIKVPRHHILIQNFCSFIREIMDNMENRRETLTKKDNITINIAQESYERACITDVHNIYNTLVQQYLQLRV